MYYVGKGRNLMLNFLDGGLFNMENFFAGFLAILKYKKHFHDKCTFTISMVTITGKLPYNVNKLYSASESTAIISLIIICLPIKNPQLSTPIF